jgi:hypothetical protein
VRHWRLGEALTTNQAEPAEVVDPLLWRDAQQMLDRHAGQDHDGSCVWCGWQWPCPPRRLAERAATASCRPWRESPPPTPLTRTKAPRTARHDLNGLRALPSWRSDVWSRRLFD